MTVRISTSRSGRSSFEAFDGVAEQLDLGRLVAHELAQERVKGGGVLHLRPPDLLPVLIKRDLFGVVEQDVGVGVALGELLGDFRV